MRSSFLLKKPSSHQSRDTDCSARGATNEECACLVSHGLGAHFRTGGVQPVWLRVSVPARAHQLRRLPRAGVRRHGRLLNALSVLKNSVCQCLSCLSPTGPAAPLVVEELAVNPEVAKSIAIDPRVFHGEIRNQTAFEVLKLIDEVKAEVFSSNLTKETGICFFAAVASDFLARFASSRTRRSSHNA